MPLTLRCSANSCGLQELLSEGVHEATAVRVLMQLLAPDSRRHFPPAIYDMLHPPQRTVKGSTGKAVTDLEGEEVSSGRPLHAHPALAHLLDSW